MSAIDFKELSSKFQNFLLIDVRKPNELDESGRLPGAINIPVQELHEALDLNGKDFEGRYGITSLQKDDSSLVFYCRSGRRVGTAQEILNSKGFHHHRLYYGSYMDWKENGGKIELNKSVTVEEKEIVKISPQSKIQTRSIEVTLNPQTIGSTVQ